MQTKSSRGQFVAGSIATLLGVAAAGRGARAATSFNVINTGANDSLALQQLIINQKYFEQFGLTVKTQNVSDGVKLLAGIINDPTAVAMLTGFPQVFPAIEAGAQLKLISGALLPPDVVIYTANPAIKTLKDCEGKSIGTGAPGALIYQATVAMLKRGGVNIDKVQFVNIGSSSDVFRAVAAKKVDAGPGQHDFMRDANGMGVRVVADGVKVIPDFTQQASFTTDKAIAENRDSLVRVLSAYGKAYRFLHTPASQSAWVDAYKQAVGNDSAEEAAYKWQWFNSNVGYDAALTLDAKRIDYMQRLNLELGSQKAMLPLSKCSDPTLARDAAKKIDESMKR